METILFRRVQRELRTQIPGKVEAVRNAQGRIIGVEYKQRFAHNDPFAPGAYVILNPLIAGDLTIDNWIDIWIAALIQLRQKVDPFLTYVISGIGGNALPLGPFQQNGMIRYQMKLKGYFDNVETGEEWEFEKVFPMQTVEQFMLSVRNEFQQMSNYDYIDFGCTEVSIVATIMDNVGIGRDWVQNHDKYFIVSFRSTVNCMVNSILFGYRAVRDPRKWLYELSFEEAKQKIQKASSDLKCQKLAKIDRDISWEGLLPLDRVTDVARHATYGTKFAGWPEVKVFDNQFHCVKHVKGSLGNKVLVELMIQGNHCLTMVPKDLVNSLSEEEKAQVLKAYTALSYESMDAAGAVRDLIEDKRDIAKGMVEDKMGREFKHRRTRYRQLVAMHHKTPEEMKEFERLHGQLRKFVAIGAWDIETWKKNEDHHFYPYAAMYFWNDRRGDPHEYTKLSDTPDENVLVDFMTRLHEEMIESKTDDLVLYAHNGASFDLLALLDRVILSNEDHPWRVGFQINQNGSFASLELVSIVNPDVHVVLRDSMKLFGPTSLDDLTKNFDVTHKKLKDAYSHDEVDWAFIENNKDLIKKYLYNDVLGLYEVMEKCQKEILDKFEVNIAQCVTGASLSKEIFFEKFYKPEKQRLFELPHDIEKKVRAAYFGGRTEVGWQGYFPGKIHMEDVTSLYPTMACKDLPVGRPVRIVGEDLQRMIESQSFFGYVVCRVRSVAMEEGYRPLHACRARNRLVFPYFADWTELCLFSEEIYKARNDGGYYDYEVIEGFHFQRYPVLKEYMESMASYKIEGEREGNKVKRAMGKLLANSGYGWFAIRVDNKASLHVYPKSENRIAQHFVRDELVSWCDRGDYQIVKTVEDLPIRNYNVAIAAAITSYARMYLHEIITAIESTPVLSEELRAWMVSNDIQSWDPSLIEHMPITLIETLEMHKVFYWDTDSVASNCDLSQFPHLMAKFAWDGLDDFRKMGKELGSLKNEAQEMWEKNKIPLTEMPYFHRIITLLPKLYMLEFDLPDGRVYSKGASKGISRKEPLILKEDRTIWKGPECIGRVNAQYKAETLAGEKLVLNGSVMNEKGVCTDLRGNELLDVKGRKIRRGAPSFEEMRQLLDGTTLLRANTSFKNSVSVLLKEKFKGDLLSLSVMQRSLKIKDASGGNRYMKGKVLENGFVAPLIIPDDCPEVNNKFSSLIDTPALPKRFNEDDPEAWDELEFDDLLDYVDAQDGRLSKSKFEKWYAAVIKSERIVQAMEYNRKAALRQLSDSEETESDSETESESEVSEASEELEHEPGLHHVFVESEPETESENEEEDEVEMRPRKRSRFIDDEAGEGSSSEE
jgi:hypothetical protein